MNSWHINVFTPFDIWKLVYPKSETNKFGVQDDIFLQHMTDICWDNNLFKLTYDNIMEK